VVARRIVALAWHQRTSAIDTRERLLEALTDRADRVLLATCHRVELYAALPGDTDGVAWAGTLPLGETERATMTFLDEERAVAHLFTVAAGLDSAVLGEPQILAQVRRAYAAATEPALLAVLGQALHVGRAVRARAGLSSARSVGSLAVDVVLGDLPQPSRATVLVIGAGEMGKLALRALVRRVRSVIIANRDLERATALAGTYDARAIPLADVESALASSDAVISAADTRGAVLSAEVLAPRVRVRPLVVVDVAVPRSVSAEARALLRASYRSVDDLPGSRARVPDAAVDAAVRLCQTEASRFCERRAPQRAEAIRRLRDDAERVRAAKLARALKRLGHLSARDRRVVEALSENLTRALMHGPTVAVRERGTDTSELFGRLPR
jgi:glutamyl-tRNA reductase